MRHQCRGYVALLVGAAAAARTTLTIAQSGAAGAMAVAPGPAVASPAASLSPPVAPPEISSICCLLTSPISASTAPATPKSFLNRRQDSLPTARAMSTSLPPLTSPCEGRRSFSSASNTLRLHISFKILCQGLFLGDGLPVGLQQSPSTLRGDVSPSRLPQTACALGVTGNSSAASSIGGAAEKAMVGPQAAPAGCPWADSSVAS
mmetsp:Transcript_113259/g.359961  ORF Transcript_113259/g.359961 Transcript_113259/m.359961 type:complete len:205 (-) Transcript_113259:531-1145(-)